MSTQTTMSTEEHEDRILRAILRTSQQAGKACDAARYDGRGGAPQRRQACATLRDFWSSGAPQTTELSQEHGCGEQLWVEWVEVEDGSAEAVMAAAQQLADDLRKARRRG